MTIASCGWKTQNPFTPPDRDSRGGSKSQMHLDSVQVHSVDH
eukprot:gene7016-7760_t